MRGDRLLVATGRHVDLAAIGAASIGVDETARALPVDDHLRVCDGVWAVGDITGKGAFTHMSMYQADIVVTQILGRPVTAADYRAVPRVTFTDPEIGSVGLSEAAARAGGMDVATGSALVSSSARGWIHKAGNDGFIKLVEDAGPGRSWWEPPRSGPAGGEVLGLLTLAVHAEIPTEQLRHMIYAYPTFHRGILDALADLARRPACRTDQSVVLAGGGDAYGGANLSAVGGGQGEEELALGRLPHGVDDEPGCEQLGLDAVAGELGADLGEQVLARGEGDLEVEIGDRHHADRRASAAASRCGASSSFHRATCWKRAGSKSACSSRLSTCSTLRLNSAVTPAASS